MKNVILAAFYQRKAKRFVPLTSEELRNRAGMGLGALDVQELVSDGLIRVEPIYHMSKGQYIVSLTPKGEREVLRMVSEGRMPGDVPIKVSPASMPWSELAKIENARMRQNTGNISTVNPVDELTDEMRLILDALQQPKTHSEIMAATGLAFGVVQGNVMKLLASNLIQRLGIVGGAKKGSSLWGLASEPEN